MTPILTINIWLKIMRNANAPNTQPYQINQKSEHSKLLSHPIIFCFIPMSLS